MNFHRRFFPRSDGSRFGQGPKAGALQLSKDEPRGVALPAMQHLVDDLPGQVVSRNEGCTIAALDRSLVETGAGNENGGIERGALGRGQLAASEHLGLFDTPPTRQQIQLSLAILGMLSAALLLVFPIRATKLDAVPAFIPVLDAFMLFSDLVIATLLFAQASIFRSRGLTVLASGYLFSALILIPHAMTFPGAFAPHGLLSAGVNTTAWLAIFRRLAFPFAAITYASLKSADSAAQASATRTPAPVAEAAIAAVVLVALATFLTTQGHDLLPPVFRNTRDTVPTSLVFANAVTILFTVAAIVLLERRDKSVLDLWLLVGLAAWVLQSLLNITLQTRYTIGWYGLNAMTLASSLVLAVALIAESNRLYARLALQTAARERERDARLTSLDAITAAIAHEIGQPVAATRLSVAAGLKWLDRKNPDPGMAIKSMRAAIEAGNRIFDVINSVRETYSRGATPLSEFNLNDLIHETAQLLELEFASQRISLRLDLDETSAPVLANRTQIQRVLMNLLINAIDSMGAVRRRATPIEIHAKVFDCDRVLVEITDSGVGISSGRLKEIFEPFVTTKPGGTGLGLWLSRTIVEEHGGRLWASSNDRAGATFHLQLPLRRRSSDEL